MTDIVLPDRAFYRADLMEELEFSKSEADRFLQQYGRKQGFGRFRFVTQRELVFMQLDGTLAKFVKENCREDRRTVAERRVNK